uniref:Hemocyanin subunit 2 n=1 Tax=Hadrurus spadix TaxID=141984 RepID=A0A1W7RAG7_9SCOR
MTLEEKQNRVLSLFRHLTSLTRTQLGEDERDPRLKSVGKLSRGSLFSCFHAEHLHEAQILSEVLFAAKDFEDFIHLCTQARNIVNEGLFVFAVSVALLHREDCVGIHIPPIQEIFPDRFITAETINNALKADRRRTDDTTIRIPIKETGNILDPEYNLAYFREDVEINAHHWHWHIVYPATWRSEVMHKVKDRKGELFFYMHQQMCARYDCDRLSVGLPRMRPFHNFEEGLEGYSPHLTSLISGLGYASRPAGLSMRDLPEVDVQDMERWRDRILDSIHIGTVIDEGGNEIPLDIEHGVDILGCLMESNEDSKNHEYYGSLHNWGHVMMARLHDPDGRYKTNPGVMSDTGTSLRDPIFYRWHRFIDNIFQEYKQTLPSYTKDELGFPGVAVVNVKVTVDDKKVNAISTFIKEDELELSYGINLKGSVKVLHHHLDHEPFKYTINVNNTSGAPKAATVRVFLGPTTDELGNPLVLDTQRRFFIELDKFHKELPAGKSTIERASTESSVTISHVPTVEEIKKGEHGPHDSEYCSCGWPQHMLLPRGNHRGMKFQLVVILTDWEHDKVVGASDTAMCSDAVSYCGAKDDKYPDKRAMGFPFDRPIHSRTIADFSTHNMANTVVEITFKEHN